MKRFKRRDKLVYKHCAVIGINGKLTKTWTSMTIEYCLVLKCNGKKTVLFSGEKDKKIEKRREIEVYQNFESPKAKNSKSAYLDIDMSIYQLSWTKRTGFEFKMV